jgi:CRP-like cAMP-binding protein
MKPLLRFGSCQMSAEPGDVPAQLAFLRTRLKPLVGFSDDAWAAAGHLFGERRFAAGAHVVKSGQIVTDLHFLVAGIARYYYLTREGKEFNKSFARTGQVLSSVSSLVAGTPSPFSIQALQACTCLSIRYADFNTLCDVHREWACLARRLLEQLAIKKERREADFLTLSAADRYRCYLNEFADIADRIPHYHVASYLGITDVALSRIRRRLGLIPLNRG